MRVISGIYKRRRFEVPRSFKARPTTDFAKENLFNVLNNYFDFEEEGVRALDLFAGTGSISIELVSRGCSQVVSVEKDRDHFAFICQVMRELKTNVNLPIHGDVFKYIKNCRQPFDFIFADPPYDLPNFAEVPERILNSAMLKDDTIVVIEHSKNYDFSHLPHFWQHRSYGSVNFSIFRIDDPE